MLSATQSQGCGAKSNFARSPAVVISTCAPMPAAQRAVTPMPLHAQRRRPVVVVARMVARGRLPWARGVVGLLVTRHYTMKVQPCNFMIQETVLGQLPALIIV